MIALGALVLKILCELDWKITSTWALSSQPSAGYWLESFKSDITLWSQFFPVQLSQNVCIVGRDLLVVRLGSDIWSGLTAAASACEIGERSCDFETARIRIGGQTWKFQGRSRGLGKKDASQDLSLLIYSPYYLRMYLCISEKVDHYCSICLNHLKLRMFGWLQSAFMKLVSRSLMWTGTSDVS